jgi:hypothetical protein
MTIVKRWALRNRFTGRLYARFPRKGEELYSSRREAVAARLSGSLYVYQPAKVEVRTTQERKPSNA